MGKSFLVFLTVLTVVCLLVSPVAAYKITLVGEVNDNHQFVAEDEIYEIKNNAVGEDLVLNYVSQKVKVVGVLKETRDSKIITVESFEVVNE
jgi:hypothetical protein